MFEAVKSGESAKVKMLLNAGYDPNIKSASSSITPIFFAPNKQIAQLLIEAGADLNVKDIETINYLIQNGANTRYLDYRVIEKKYSNFSKERLYQVERFLAQNRFKAKY